MADYKQWTTGEPAPWFTQESSCNGMFNFSNAAGPYLILAFIDDAQTIYAKNIASFLEKNRSLFDEKTFAFFGVSHSEKDKKQQNLKSDLPGIRYFWDHSQQTGRAYGAIPLAGDGPFRPLVYLMDPSLRIVRIFTIPDTPSSLDDIAGFLKNLPSVNKYAGLELQAPVLFLPNVFEPSFCEQLIELYKIHGGINSGFMLKQGHKSVYVENSKHKKRADHVITDQAIIDHARVRIARCIVPEIHRAYQFNVSRIERYIVGRYAAEDGGFFGAHRDNTTGATAHRRFAVSINLNHEFQGGEVSFPEFGTRTFKPPPGGAVVFSCSLLHAVSPVTSGERYAFLPFLYDEAAKTIRDKHEKESREMVETP